MMTTFSAYRLEGFEPDNLLAFMAILGVLRSLEEAEPDWHPRVYWDIDVLPVRPVLSIVGGAKEKEVLMSIAAGLGQCASQHDFEGIKDLKLSPEIAAQKLHDAASGKRYTADLWASLISNVVIHRNGKQVEPTPLCLMFGQGHQHFLERLALAPQLRIPPARGRGKKKEEISELKCLREALFEKWRRRDATFEFRFRWDPHEDVRHALRAMDPTVSKTKTQHGANRLAAVGFSTLTVYPKQRYSSLQLKVLGGARDRKGSFIFTWPIWRHPVSLASIRGLLSHPSLDDREVCEALGVVGRFQARRISAGKFMNFTRAVPRDF